MHYLNKLGLFGIVASLVVLASMSATSAAASGSYRIQSGETLGEIADSFGIPLDVLATQNHIANVNLIYAGENLIIPTGTQGTSSASSAAGSGAGGATYRIRPGDTLWTIAEMRSVTLQQLISSNPEIVDPNRVYVDQTIVVPGSGAAGLSAAQPTLSTRSLSRADVPWLIASYANSYGIDPTLVQALAWQESGWNQAMVSPSGALGIMQIMPATGSWLARDVVGQPLDIANSAADNVHAGVAYLGYLIDRSGSVELALAGYYQGPGSLQAYGMLPGTRQYVANVMAIRSYLLIYGVPPGA
jgi:LysM repeat protein